MSIRTHWTISVIILLLISSLFVACWDPIEETTQGGDDDTLSFSVYQDEQRLIPLDSLYDLDATLTLFARFSDTALVDTVLVTLLDTTGSTFDTLLQAVLLSQTDTLEGFIGAYTISVEGVYDLQVRTISTKNDTIFFIQRLTCGSAPRYTTNDTTLQLIGTLELGEEVQLIAPAFDASEPYTRSWIYDEVMLPDTTDTLSFTSIKFEDSGTYALSISNQWGTLTIDEYHLSLATNKAPYFASIAINDTAVSSIGDTLFLSVKEKDTLRLLFGVQDSDIGVPYFEVLDSSIDSSWVKVAGTGLQYTVDILPFQTLVQSDSVVYYTAQVYDLNDSSSFSKIVLQVTIENVNIIPKIVAVPTELTVGLDNDYAAQFSVHDSDGVTPAVSISIDTGSVTYDAGTEMIKWTPSRFHHTVGDVVTFTATVTDGVDSIDTSWTVAITAHDWEFISTLNEGALLAAKTKDTMALVYSYQDSRIGLSSIDGGLSWSSPFANVMYTTPKDVTFVGGKFFMSGYDSWATFHVFSPFNVDALDTSYNAYIKTGVSMINPYDSIVYSASNGSGGATGTWIRQSDGVEQDFTTAFYVTSITGAKEALAVYIGSTAGIHRKSYLVPSEFRQCATMNVTNLTVASNDGESLYAILNDGIVLKSSNMLDVVPSFSSVIVDSTSSIAMRDSNDGFAIISGKLVSTVSSFTEKTSEVIVDNSGIESATIEQIVISEDGLSVYAVDNDGKLFRY